MIGKNNKKLKELKQGVKVESYSIKKFKFGAASIVIGASIFFGTGVASANEVAASSDSSATNDTNATSGNGDKIPEKINTVSAEKESVTSVNKPSSVKEESTKVEVEKKVVDKSLLETSITKLEELLATVNKDKAPASTLSAVNVDLINAKSILENANASQEEVDALVKKLKQQTQIVSSMPKVTTKEKEVKEGANTIANSGSRDSRNGQRMAQGTNFRANGQISKGALADIRYYASVDPNQNGGRKTRNDEPELTRSKTDIKAYYVQDSEGKWIVYDVFFNNDGNKMTGLSKQQEYYFQGPFNIMDLTSDGYYKDNTVKDLYFTRYAPKNRNSGKKLSDGFEAFEQYGNTAYISDFKHQNSRIFHNDRVTMYDPYSGLYRDDQKKDVFKNNKDDRELDKLPRNKNGGYPGASYYLGLKLGEASTNYAVHMHAKIKLRDNVTPEEAAQYGRVYAATTTKGWTTNHSYIMGSWSARLQNEPDAPKDPIQGLTVTKTVGDNPGDKINPVSEGYVRHKNGKSFPAGMNWTWAGDKSPNTDVAGVFKYKSIATYKDGSTSEDKGSGSDGTVTLNVKPKKPIINKTDVANKKGLPNQRITVNVKNGVPDGSTVNLYDGTKLIGTGKTSGGAATVTVTDALPGNPITAETVVTNNNGTVKSDKSDPVTPTPKPDTQAPTLTVTPAEQVVKVGEKISFNVDGRDDTKVNLDFTDLATKYASHLFTQKTTYSVNTDKQKTLSIDLGAAKESDIGEKTITFKATDDANHEIVKTVKVKVIPATKENEKHNPTAETVVVGIKQELTDEAIKAKVKNYPSNATLTVKQKPDTDTTGNKTATVIVTYSDKSTDEVTVPVVVRDTTPPKIYWAKDDGSKVELGKTHAEGQNIVIPLYRGDEVNTRLITTDDSGKVTNFKMENLQSGFNFTPVSGTATEGSPLGQNVTGKVGLSVAKGKYTARAISTDGTNSTTGHFVFEVHEQAEKYTPAANTLTVPFNHKITDDEVKGKVIAKPGTPAFPNGTIFEVVSKPETNTTGTDKKAVVKITYPDKSTENIDVPVHVGKDLASQHPLEGHTVTVTVGDSLKTWRGRVDSNQYTNAPKGRGNGVEWGWKGTTPKVVQDTAGVFKYTATATHTDKSVAESNPQVTVIVKPKAPTIETDLTGKAELPNTAVVVNVHEGVKNGSIVTLYSQDGRAIGTGTVTNGKATITGTIPKGNITAKTTVQTPGEQDVTSDPSPEKVATTNKAALYPIKGKTATVTVGDSLRQWNGRVDANQYTEAGPNGKGIGVEWGWEGTAPKILQDTAGVFKYTATATHTDKTVAKSDPKVTIIVKPKQPTIETDLTGKSNQENVPVTVSVGGGVKDGSTVTLYGPDGTTVIGTGTVTNGKATAIITGKVPVGNITAKTTVQTPGQDDVVSEPSPIKEATNIAPTAKTQTVGLNEKPNAKNSIGNNGNLPNGTNYTWKTTPDTSTPGDKPGVVTVTYPDGSTIDVPVTVKVTQVSDDYTPKYEDGSGKPGSKVEIPLKEENGKDIPVNTTYVSDQPGVIDVDDKGKVTVTIPKDKNPGDKVTGKITVTYPDGSTEEVPVTVTVTNRDKDDYTPKYEDGSGKPGTNVEIPLTEENKKDIPEKTKFESDTPEIKVDDKGKVTVTIPKDKNPGDKVTGKITVTYPDGSTEEVPVTVTVTNRDKDDYTPKYEDGSGKPGTNVEIPLTEENKKDIPEKTKFESDTPEIKVDDKGKVTVTIPKDKNPGDKVTGKITVTYPDGSTEEVPVTVTVTDRDKDVYTPKYEDGSGKPGTNVEIPLTEENKKDIPEKTKFESDTPEIKVDDKGKVTVTIPKDKNPGDKITGKITVTYPDGSTEEVPVTVTVTNRDKDDYTPKYEDGSGKPGTNVEIPLTEENKKDIPEKTKFESDTPEIKVDDKGKVTVTIPKDKNPGDKVTGKITVTYPDGSTEEVPVTVTVTDRDKDVYTPKYEDGSGKPGTNVEIPLTEENKKDIPEKTKFESDTPEIKVDDKGKVTVTIPKDKNPGDKVTGKITVTYPDGSTEEVPVTVTVTDRDKDVYTPKYEDGSGKPGTNVEIPLTEENKKDIPEKTKFESDTPEIKVDDKGKVTVTIPKDKNPGDKITGKITVTYPDGSTEEVPVTVTVTNRDKDDYTPKYEDGSGKPGTNVEIPLTEENKKDIPEKTKFESDTPEIKVDDKGKVTVTIPKDKNPGDKVTGKITVTYPDGSTEEVPVTVTVTDRDKDVYTPKYEDGSGKPGTNVEIPLTEENKKDIPEKTKFESDTPEIKVDDKGKVTVTIPKDKNPGDKITGKITVTYPDGSTEEVPVTVTVTNRDKDDYTPKYEDGSGKPGTNVEIPLTEENKKDIPEKTKFESDTPEIKVDDKGKVTVTIPKDKNPGDKVTGKITVTYPDGSTEEVPVTVTVTDRDKDVYTPKYEDGSGKPGTNVEIPLTEENKKDIPEKTKFESDTPEIKVDDKGKVTVTIPKDKNPGDKVTGKITVTYPDGSTEEVPVTVTVTDRDKDVYTPKYEDGSGKPGTNVEIPLTEENKKDIPEKTKFESDTPEIKVDDKGKVTVTIPKDKNPGDKITGKITVTYPDGSTEEVPVTVTVTNRDKDDYTPKYEDGSGKPGTNVEIPLTEENKKDIPEKTKFESDTPEIKVDDKGKVTVTIPKDKNPGDKVTGKITVTYPDGSTEEVPVTVTVTDRDKDVYTPKYEDGSGKPGTNVEIPLTEENKKDIPEKTKFESDTPEIKVDDKGKVTVTIPKDKNPGDKITGKITVTYPDGSTEEVPVTVTVTDRDKDVYTPKYEDGNGKPGSKVEIPLTEENGKKIPDGTTFESDKPGVITVDKDGKVTVTIPEGAKPGDKITGKVKVRYPDGSTEEIPVTVTVGEQDKDIYTPKYEDGNGKPGSKVEIPLTEENGKKIPDGTTFESDKPGVITVGKDGKVTVTIPEGAKPGDKITGKVKVRYPDGSTEEIPVTVTVGEQDKDIYTPKYEDGNGKPGSKVEIPLTEENGKKIPDGTTFESDKPGVITVGKDGKVTVTIPEGAKPGDKITGKVKVRYPDGSTEEIPVTVTVGEQDKDIYTPKYEDGNGKPGSKVEIPLTEENGKKIPDGTTFESDKPGVITVDKDGKVTVTIPEGAKPGDKITGKVKVRYPDGSTEEIPVTVTVGEQDKDIYTPKYEDGNGKPGSKVEIPLTEENGKKIPDGTTFESDKPGVITVGKDGKVTVTIPEGAKPGDKITGKVKVRYPDGSTEEIPVTVTVGEQDKDIYTPKYEDGNGKPGSKVEIPLTEENGKKIPDGTTFESDKPGVITVDKDGKVTVTIPEGAKPGDKITGKVKVRYPDGSTEEIPVTVTVGEQDKDIYTPKYEDGNGKPGSKVEIPLTEENGKKIPDGTTFESDKPGVITVGKDGKVTVTIPEGAKPGDKITGKVKVRYPDGSTEEIPVTVTVGEQDKDIYTPKYEDGNGKPGSKVEIPLTEENGKKIPDGTTFESDKPGVITVDKDGKVTVTIPEGAKPGDKITGKVKVRYPDGSTEEIPVTVTVGEQDKDIYTPKYEDGNGKPGSKVEIPLTEENGKKIPDGTTFESDKPGVITVDKDGKVTVTIPEGAKPGDKITGKVKVRYPDGSTEEIPVTVTVTTPGKVTPDTPTKPVEPTKQTKRLANTGTTETNTGLAGLGLGILGGLLAAARRRKNDKN